MTQYHAFDTDIFNNLNVEFPQPDRPELVHMDDPAQSILWDFEQACPHFCTAHQSIDHASEEMSSLGTHWIFVLNADHIPVGVLGIKETLGPKPLQMMKQRKIWRISSGNWEVNVNREKLRKPLCVPGRRTRSGQPWSWRTLWKL